VPVESLDGKIAVILRELVLLLLKDARRMVCYGEASEQFDFDFASLVCQQARQLDWKLG
jgi:hypothetical protein